MANRDAGMPASSEPLKVKLIGFNDFHGNLKMPATRVPVPDPAQSTGMRFEPAGGIEQFSALVKSLKAKNPNHAVVTAGDLVGATPLLSALFHDEPTIEAMNEVGLDFHAVGNHEFDYGIKHLKRLKEGGCKVNDKTGQPDCGGRPPYAGANFPFLAANVIEESTGKTLFPPYGIKEFEGIKVGFIGLTLRGTPLIVRPSGTNGVVFRDEVETVNRLVPELRSQGVEAIIVLIHEGGIQSGGINDCTDFRGEFREMVEKFDPAVDVVLSAHTHRYYVCEFGGKLVTSAGSYGTLVTEIDLQIDRRTRDVIKREARNLVVRPDGPKDPVQTALVAKYAKLSEPLENRVIAKVSQEIPYTVNPSGESPLGNVIADAQLFSTASPEKGGSVIAFNNPGSLRSPIIPGPDGSVTYGNLFRVQPFQNDLIVMNLTGAQLKAALEQQFEAERPRLLGVSKGFSYSWDLTRPAGDRVIAESLQLNGTRIRPDLQYRVVANSFLASGSEGFTVFREGTDRQVSILDLEALVNYLSANSTFTPPPVGSRIKRLH
jgi:5'-nucleotidase